MGIPTAILHPNRSFTLVGETGGPCPLAVLAIIKGIGSVGEAAKAP